MATSVKNFTDSLIEDYLQEGQSLYEAHEGEYDIVKVWVGTYVGDDEYEGGMIDIQFKSPTDDFDDLYDNLKQALQNQVDSGNSSFIDDLENLEYIEKFIFYLADGSELTYEL